MNNFKKEINDHLRSFGKTELIDSHWIDRMVFVMARILETEKIILKIGMTQNNGKGWTQKNGDAQSYEGLLKTYGAISAKLGMSPKDRQAWIKQTKAKNEGGLIK